MQGGLKRKSIPTVTCFLMGLCGTALLALAGLLMLLRRGTGGYLQIAALALQGGMLLFLAATEKGEAGKPVRLKLLGLFFLLLASGFVPVPLGQLAGLFVLPLLLRLYPAAPGGLVAALWVGEAGYAAASTLAITGFTGALSPYTVLSGALLCIGLLRSAALAYCVRAARVLR